MKIDNFCDDEDYHIYEDGGVPMIINTRADQGLHPVALGAMGGTPAKMEDKIRILKMIADDMANDAKNFEGRPFNGKTVAEYLGNQGAGIAALADIVRSLCEDTLKEAE